MTFTLIFFIDGRDLSVNSAVEASGAVAEGRELMTLLSASCQGLSSRSEQRISTVATVMNSPMRTLNPRKMR